MEMFDIWITSKFIVIFENKKIDICAYCAHISKKCGYYIKINFGDIMLDNYYKMKVKYLDYILLFKRGNFYYCYKEDAYIIHYFFDYKLKNDMVAFSIEALDKVLKILDKNDLAYIIYDSIILDKTYGDSEKFSYFYNLSLDLIGRETVIKNINDKLKYYTLEELLKLVSTI